MWEKELAAQSFVRHYVFTGARYSGYRKWVLKNPDVILHINQDQGLNFKPFLWYLPKFISDDSRKGEGSCGRSSQNRVHKVVVPTLDAGVKPPGRFGLVCLES